jgi:uncharacterized protein (UPF0333 family)
MELTKNNFLLLFFFILLAESISFVYAQQNLKPVLYGQVFNGNQSADGSIVTVYPQNNQSDNLTDIVWKC